MEVSASALCLMSCLLLIALWVRSYWRSDIFGATFGQAKRATCASDQGYPFAIILGPNRRKRKHSLTTLLVFNNAWLFNFFGKKHGKVTALSMAMSAMQINKTMSIISRLFVLLAFLGPLIAWRIYIAKNSDARLVNLSGTVIDHATRKPVAGARVIVGAHDDWSFGPHFHYFGIIADEEGKFGVMVDSPWRVDRVSVQASRADDHCGAVQEVHSSAPVVLELVPLGKEFKDDYWMHFAHFSGNGRPQTWNQQIEFIGPGWEIHTPHEIEIGLPAAGRIDN